MSAYSRRLWRPAAIAAALLATACADRSNQPTSDSAADANAAPFRVALLTPGPISDQSWNGGAYAGLLRIRDSLGATISHIQTRTPAEFEQNFREYGAQGYALVIGHGYEYQDAARRVAPNFPRTAYLVSSSDAAQPPNVAGIKFAFAEASYLAGMVAGQLTRTNIVGMIGGQELPPVRESFDFFAAGARAVNSAVNVRPAYLGSWDDVSAGKEQALAQIGRGVDVIFQNADAAGLGVFQAARETGRATIIGSNADQNALAPSVTAGSVVIDIPRAFLSVARHVRDGTFEPKTYEMGATTGVVTLVLNPAFAAAQTPAIRATVDSMTALIMSRRFDASSIVPSRPR